MSTRSAMPLQWGPSWQSPSAWLRVPWLVGRRRAARRRFAALVSADQLMSDPGGEEDARRPAKPTLGVFSPIQDFLTYLFWYEAR